MTTPLHRPAPRQTAGRWRVDCSCGWAGPLVSMPGQGTGAWTEHFKAASGVSV